VSIDLSRQVADAARELQDSGDPSTTMERAVRLAVQLVPGAYEAGITLARRGKGVETPAATDALVEKVEGWQYELDEGPCLDAIGKQEVVRSRDVGADERWPSWGPKVARETGFRSMLCFRLFTHEDLVGGLNLYSYDVDGFNEADLDEGLAFAAQTAVAIAAAREIAQLRLAVDGRTVIGQAQGILMERFELDATQSFAVLARVSQARNVKVRQIAEELVITRHLPE
jgi:hypothetical protein